MTAPTAIFHIIDQECAANEIFKNDRNNLLVHCAVLAEVVVLKRTMTMFVARGILAALAGGEKFITGLNDQLDNLVYDHVDLRPILR